MNMARVQSSGAVVAQDHVLEKVLVNRVRRRMFSKQKVQFEFRSLTGP